MKQFFLDHTTAITITATLIGFVIYFLLAPASSSAGKIREFILG